MKALNLKQLFILMSLIPFAAQSLEAGSYPLEDKVLYGKDDRKLTTDLHSKFDEKILSLSKSVLAMVDNSSVVSIDSEKAFIRAGSLKETFGLCRDESFVSEPSTSTCSGFLVAPDVLVTAGHCVRNLKSCETQSWLLDYEAQSSYGGNKFMEIPIEKKSLLGCKEILKVVKTSTVDYAIIKLNRKVHDRKALELRQSGNIGENDHFFILGHPLGMPKTLTDNIVLRQNTKKDYFTVVADTFQGNSGSPLFNAKTNLVEGILVRGEQDLVFSFFGLCNKVKRCNFMTCKTGEEVQKITTLPKDLLK